jgi:hypothetical protein
LRLYFVDVPESGNSFPARVAEQAAYFSINSKQALGIGIEAALGQMGFMELRV